MAYIVNTDPEGEPGQYWLVIWTEYDVLDSYGLPLTTYIDGMVGRLAPFTVKRTDVASREQCRLWPLRLDVFEHGTVCAKVFPHRSGSQRSSRRPRRPTIDRARTPRRALKQCDAP